MPASTGLRVLGFPVHVRPGFLVFLLIVIFLYGGSLGLWAAGTIAVFTLVHELGHALAARATGARAEIALDFLAGYAAYQPSRPLARWERAAIAAAGPFVQLTSALVVLLVMGVDPLSRSDVLSSEAAATIWWAGFALALVNLLPVVPLDGGTILGLGLDRIVPGQGRRLMTWISLGLTGVMLVALLANDSLRPFTFVVGLLIVMQVQQLSAQRSRSPAAMARDAERYVAMAQRTESEAWRTGRPGALMAGQTLSPWFRASRALADGDPDRARAVLVADLTGEDPGQWFPPGPDVAPDAVMAGLVDLLPQPPPHGKRSSEEYLVGLLVRLGRLRPAAEYGAASFTRSPSTATAVHVARAVAALGDDDLAVRWLQAAASAGDRPYLLAQSIDHAPELSRLRPRTEVQALRSALAGTSG